MLLEMADRDPSNHPHLRKVLKSYKERAPFSLNGPKDAEHLWKNETKVDDREEAKKCNRLQSAEKKQAQPIMPPIMLPPDQNNLDMVLCQFEGYEISGFEIGGEVRLCLHELSNSILTDFSLLEIQRVADDIQIYRAPCTPNQLKLLIDDQRIQAHVKDCELIRKSDAERLCHRLLESRRKNQSQSRVSLSEDANLNAIHVEHRCFGKAKGVFRPQLYRTVNDVCIQCNQCHQSFAPQEFVRHTDDHSEVRVCHWGFDSANWRQYLRLDSKEKSERAQKIFDEIKARFERRLKRKHTEETRDDTVGTKRAAGSAAAAPTVVPCIPFAYSVHPMQVVTLMDRHGNKYATPVLVKHGMIPVASAETIKNADTSMHNEEIASKQVPESSSIDDGSPLSREFAKVSGKIERLISDDELRRDAVRTLMASLRDLVKYNLDRSEDQVEQLAQSHRNLEMNLMLSQKENSFLRCLLQGGTESARR